MLFSLSVHGQPVPLRIGAIEFFGAAGRDTAALRATLPVREGAAVDPRDMARLVDEIRAAAHAADVAVVCCGRQGTAESWTLYIGWPDGPGRRFRYDPPPQGTARLPRDGVKLAQESWAVWQQAAEAGVSEEIKPSSDLDERLRATETAIRHYTMRYGAELRHILHTSGQPQHRAIAAHFLGYGRRSRAQVHVLVDAFHDSDEGVRDSAARALLVLLRTDMRVAAWMPAAHLVAMLHSGHWADRQRAALLLASLSAEENPKLLAEIRDHAWPALLEMAQWRSAEQAAPARQLLGRAGGLDEPRLQALLRGGDVEALLEAVATIR